MGIPFVTEPAVSHGVCERVSPLIRRVVAPNPSRFTYHGTGTYLVGHGDIAVIDPGPAIPDHIDAVIAAVEPGERITHVLVTHTHSDHSPGCALLTAHTDAPTHGFGPHGLVRQPDPDDVVVFGDPEADGPFDDETSRTADGELLREGADTDFVPDVLLVDGDVVTGTDWSLRAVHTPGHTSNHLCFALGAESALFTGDHVMGWSTSVIGPPDGNMSHYLASLEKLLGREDAIYWPTHGRSITDPATHVRAFLQHRRDRDRQILDVLRHGPRSIAEIVPAVYAEVDKRLWRPAGASVFAHLLGMIDEGLVTSDPTPRRSGRFQLAD